MSTFSAPDRALAKPNPSVLSGPWMMRRNADRAQCLRVAAVMLGLGSAFAVFGCLSGPLSEGNAAKPNLDAKVYPISCEEGRRYAAKTFKARNYRITSVSRS